MADGHGVRETRRRAGALIALLGLAGGMVVAAAPGASASGPVLSTSPITIDATRHLAFSGSVGGFQESPVTNPASSFTAAISWGDGTSSAGTIVGAGGSFTVSGAHTFASGGLSTVQAVIHGPGSEATTIVSSARVHLESSVDLHGFETASLGSVVVASFTEPEPSHVAADYTASIDWGDGLTDTGIVSGGSSSFSVSTLGHTYADEGTFPVSVRVQLTGADGPFPLVTHAVIGDDDEVTPGAPSAVGAAAGATFSGPVASFSSSRAIDPSELVATVDWGDGTQSVGTVSGGPTAFTISGAHAYVEPGTFTVKARLRDDGSGVAAASVVATAHIGGVTAGSAFVSAAYHDFLSRAPTSGELAQWASPIDHGTTPRAALVDQLSASPEWVSAIVTRLYLDTLGRAGDPGGTAYWTGRIRSGAITVAQAAAAFYSSDEYFNGFGGGTVKGWLSDLYPKLLARPVDSSGLAYWTGQVQQKGRGDVALRLYDSSPSCHVRVGRLYAKLLGRAPDAAGADYWAGQVAAHGDLSLAVDLASSLEYYHRARTRFP